MLLEFIGSLGMAILSTVLCRQAWHDVQKQSVAWRKVRPDRMETTTMRRRFHEK